MGRHLRWEIKLRRFLVGPHNEYKPSVDICDAIMDLVNYALLFPVALSPMYLF